MGTVLQRLFAKQPYDRVHVGDGPKLRRVLGAPALIAVGFGHDAGGHLHDDRASERTQAGPGVVLSFALSGLACVFVSLCYAELASMVPIAGSAYTYAYAALGEIIAWIIGWDLILEYGISVAPTAASWSGSVQLKLARLPHHAAAMGAGCARGLQRRAAGSRPLSDRRPRNRDHAVPDRRSRDRHSLSRPPRTTCWSSSRSSRSSCSRPGSSARSIRVTITRCCRTACTASSPARATVFFAYIGFDTVTVASEEAKRPERDVPWGVVGSLLRSAPSSTWRSRS